MNKLFTYIAKIEGISLLALLFFAMPMKYIYHQDIYVRYIGMAHGVLFIVYVFGAIYLKFEEEWGFKKTIVVLLGSVIPFGTFYVEKTYFKGRKNNNPLQ
jgi:integral membrane protein